MKLKLIVFAAFFGAGFYLSQPLLSEHEQERMNLRFENGKTYVFKLTSIGIPEFAPKERVPPAVDPSIRRDATQPQQPVPEGKAGAPGEGTIRSGACELECKIKVKDTSQGLTTLAVDFDRTGVLPERDITKPAPGDPGLFGSFEVVVDQSGHLVGTSNLQPGSKGTEPGSSPAAAGPACPPALRSCLEVIVGTGLHDQVLAQGKEYEIGSPPPPPASALPRSNERPQSDTDRPLPGVHEPGLPSLSFRYEGSSKRADNDGEQARFAVLVKSSSPAPSAAGPVTDAGAARGTERQPADRPGTDERPAAERREGLERGTATTQERAGDAAFRWQDGILETFSVTCPSHKATGGDAPKLSIRRVERELRPERQEN